MDITKVIKIKLEDAEIRALETLRGAYYQCISMDCLECNDCSLYVDGGCIGTYADEVLKREERK